MNVPAQRSDRRGFALVMVVFLLFAVAVAGVTGYQVVSSEFMGARQNRDGQEALAVARAGLQRFLGETVGSVGDSVGYAIGNGIARVTTRRVLRRDSLNHLYYIKSVGEVADPRTPLLPATRTVGTYAWHRMNPIPPKAAVMLSGGPMFLYAGTNIGGADHATPADCAFGGTVPRPGIAIAGSIFSLPGASYTGTPVGAVSYPNYQAAYDTVGIRWDILSNPSFPVDFHNSWPDFASLPADSFPIVRRTGDVTMAGSSFSGRGVLIVTGQLTLANDFRWNGIILAGRFRSSSTFGGTGAVPTVNGMLIGGLNAANGFSSFWDADINYHSCNAYKANRALSFLEVVDGTLFEVNG